MTSEPAQDSCAGAPGGGQRPAGSLLVLAAFTVSGAAALAYEVTWTRALSLVLGSTTYAVSTMLATFMLGLAVGALLGGRLADRRGRPLLYFGLCELGIGLAGIASVPLIYKLPALYLHLYRGLHHQPALFFAAQIVLCALVMALPTVLMGATFPLVTRALARTLEGLGGTVGRIYGANTAGAVVGALLAGFVLIPALGIKYTAIAAGLANLTVGLVLTAGAVTRKLVVIAAALALYAAGIAGASQVPPGHQLLSFYNAQRHLGRDSASYAMVTADYLAAMERVFSGSYAEGEVTAYQAQPGRNLVLRVGGKFEGTHARDMDNTLLLSYLPLAAHPRPRSMLVVGLGAGVTLGAAKPHAERVDVVEINPGVVEAVRRFGTPGLLDGVGLIRADARNHLLRSPRRYDVISSEPSYPTEAGVANLFTREYFQLAAERLTDLGVYCQWLPYYVLRNDDVTMMIKTFAAAFPHALLFKVDRTLDLLLLGSLRPLRFTPAELRRRVARLNLSGRPLSYRLSRSSAQIAAIAARGEVPVNSDDHPILEFRTVQNFLQGRLKD